MEESPSETVKLYSSTTTSGFYEVCLRLEREISSFERVLPFPFGPDGGERHDDIGISGLQNAAFGSGRTGGGVHIGEAIAMVDDPNILDAKSKIFLDLFLNAGRAVVFGEDFDAEKRGLAEDLILNFAASHHADVG